jgi:two-component system response regulator (stage 0 sporulation protein F)
MDKAKILVIEDQEETRRVVTSYLSRKGYNAFSIPTAKGAVELVKKEHPDITLLDIVLADGSGLDILKQIKEFDKNIKVVMVTVLEDEDTIKQAKSLGADEYVTKPATVDYLNNIILEKISELNLHKTIAEINRDTG